MLSWKAVYIVILYLAVANTFWRHFKRYLVMINKNDDSKLLFIAKLEAVAWPIFIPLHFLAQLFSGGLINEWSKK